MTSHSGLITLQVSDAEARYLREQCDLDSIGAVEHPARPGDRTTFEFSALEASDLEDRLADRLAQFGFDENYELVPEGELLENLLALLAAQN